MKKKWRRQKTEDIGEKRGYDVKEKGRRQRIEDKEEIEVGKINAKKCKIKPKRTHEKFWRTAGIISG